jgi:hypothetical protein
MAFQLLRSCAGGGSRVVHLPFIESTILRVLARLGEAAWIIRELWVMSLQLFQSNRIRNSMVYATAQTRLLRLRKVRTYEAHSFPPSRFCPQALSA